MLPAPDPLVESHYQDLLRIHARYNELAEEKEEMEAEMFRLTKSHEYYLGLIEAEKASEGEEEV